MNTGAKRVRLRGIFFLLAGLFGLILVLQFQGGPAKAALPQASSISVSMSNPACTQAFPASGVCTIRFHNLTASGSDPSFARVEVLVNGKLRLNVAGFFESSAYFTDLMLPGGLKVTCGVPNASGQPNFGKIYQLTANAYMADGTTASASTNVACPAFQAIAYLPFIKNK
jgi:hypothetical protein